MEVCLKGRTATVGKFEFRVIENSFVSIDPGFRRPSTSLRDLKYSVSVIINNVPYHAGWVKSGEGFEKNTIRTVRTEKIDEIMKTQEFGALLEHLGNLLTAKGVMDS